MIIDTTKTKIERKMDSILAGKISYSKQWGFFFTRSQKRAIFWKQMKDGEFDKYINRRGE